MRTKLLFFTKKNYFSSKLTKNFNNGAKHLKSIVEECNVSKIKENSAKY